mgnify:CR=1 FL=1
MGMTVPYGFCKECFRPTGSRERRYCPAHAPKSKYKNVKIPDPAGGKPYDSKREAERGAELAMQQKMGSIRNLKRQVPFPLIVGDVLVCTFIADFTYDLVRLDDTEFVVEDVKPRARKGKKKYRTREYRTKAKLFKAVMGYAIREI